MNEISTSYESKILDHEFLKDKGLGYIQDLSRNKWTDHNVHDPGITILEQLIFYITDIGFRLEKDIEEILFNKQSKDEIYLSPEMILTGNPVNVDDYRKLVFDKLFELKNIWFVPVKDSKSSISGLYNVYIDVGNNITDESIIKRIVEDVKKIYAESRNLTEDINEVYVLQPKKITLNVDIDVDGRREIEKILADITFQIDDFINPRIQFHSKEELVEEGLNYDTIFDGPRLTHGFIKNDDLKSKKNEILLSELVKIITQVDNVTSVRNLILTSEKGSHEHFIDIKSHEIPEIVINISDQLNKGVNFYRGEVKFHFFDKDYYKRILNELTANHGRSFRIINEETKADTKTSGLDLGSYFSLKEMLPGIYGTKSDGIPGKIDAERIGQANQLKGYLALFEHVIMNLLAQLNNVGQLFAVSSNQNQSYFYRYLDEIEGVKSLLTSIDTDRPLESQSRIIIEQLNNLSGDYQADKSELLSRFDNSFDRRGRFLDYLLAIHGENFDSQVISQFDYYYSNSELEKAVLNSKTLLLNSLKTINGERYKGVNYHLDIQEADKQSGLKQKSSLVLGLQQFGEATSVDSYLKKYKLQLLESLSTNYSSWIEKLSLKTFGVTSKAFKSFEHIDFETRELIADLHLQSEPFKLGGVEQNMLLLGIDAKNYRIGKNNKDEYVIVLTNDTDYSQVMVVDKDQSKAEDICLALIKELKYISLLIEDFVIIDHILLRPVEETKSYGLYLLDKDGQKIFKSDQKFSVKERYEIMKSLPELIKNPSSYSVEMNILNYFEVHFKPKNSEYTFSSVTHYASVDQAHDVQENIAEYFNSLAIEDYQNQFDFYTSYEGNVDQYIDEDYFSSTISVVLPSFTKRFSDVEFRTVLEDTIRKNAPANVYINFIWLRLTQYEWFTKEYNKWGKSLKEYKTKVSDDSISSFNVNSGMIVAMLNKM